MTFREGALDALFVSAATVSAMLGIPQAGRAIHEILAPLADDLEHAYAQWAAHP